MNVGANGQVIDENYLNQKIMYLNQERMRIADLAAKYGLVNNEKVSKLQLIEGDRYNPNMEQDPNSSSLVAVKDSKDRVQAYHEQVHARRKRIHEKQLAKKKEQDALEDKVLNKTGQKRKTVQEAPESDENEDENSDQERAHKSKKKKKQKQPPANFETTDVEGA